MTPEPNGTPGRIKKAVLIWKIEHETLNVSGGSGLHDAQRLMARAVC